MRRSAPLGLLIFASATAFAQEPPEPQEEPQEEPGRPPVPPVEESDPAPGFDEEEDPPAEKPRSDRKRTPSAYGRTPGREEPDPPLGPVDEANAEANERLLRLIKDTTGVVDLSEVLDEVLADVVAELNGLQVSRVSPLAIRSVVVGSNLRSSFARDLEHRVTALLHAGTRIRVRRCIECSATRTRVVDGKLLITRGIVTTEQLRQVGERLGIEAFLDVRFGLDLERATLEIDFQLFRASNAEILWAESYRADESTPMLLRSSEAPQTRQERIEDLRALLEGRPFFGYAASAGIMLIPYDDPVQGDIFGATAGFRLFERFGTDRRVLFGLDLMGFVNFEILSGALVSAGGWWVPFEPDLINPELRVGGKAGALIVGNEGNTTVFQLGAELLLRYRFGLYAYAVYMLDADYQGPNGNEGAKIGGLGVSAGLSFNW